MRLFFKSLILFFLVSITSNSVSFSLDIDRKEIKQTVENEDNRYLKLLIDGSNRFAFDLYHTSKNKHGNLILSPYSLVIGLAMVGEGAKDATRSEIQQTLHFSLNLSPLIQTINQYINANNHSATDQLFLVNAVWVQDEKTLVPSYTNALKRIFNYDFLPLNFKVVSEALNSINKWILDQSNGKIRQIVSYADIPRTGQFLLTSGFYWSGEWLNPFDSRQTHKAPFIYKGYSYNVEMMKQIGNQSVFTDPRFTVIEIPFKPLVEGGAQLSLTIVIPNGTIQLNNLEKELTTDNWYAWMNQLKPRLVELFLPKLRLEDKLELSREMQKLGVDKTFDSSADFSGIDTEKVHLSKIIQKVIANINENGSEISFSKNIPSSSTTETENSLTISVNQPFFFVIQEMTTRLILSIGKIEQP